MPVSLVSLTRPPRRDVVVDYLWRRPTMSALRFKVESESRSATSVFGYLAQPPRRDARQLPGVVLIHGGGGRAFPEWATMWAQRGYVALAIDLSGDAQSLGPADTAGPAQGAEGKFGSIRDGVEHTWMVHAVSAARHALSVLGALPDVDASQLYLTGISWGSHVGQLVTSIDARVRRAAFVYGAGFHSENSYTSAYLSELPHEDAALWSRMFDQKHYLPQIAAPTLWITGVNDPHYRLDLFDRSARLVSAPVTRRVSPSLGHSHEDGWSPLEVAAFFAEGAQEGPALPALSPPTIVDGRLASGVRFELPLRSGTLRYATSTDAWEIKAWESLATNLDGEVVSARLPAGWTAAYLEVEDASGVRVSTSLVVPTPTIA
ncbi:dienelactone hydrolase family protein [Microbacterium sp. NPDC087592]|uniref:dienelactone hydrolase family protein n=1 Tax=Microbacterium sp. NPDC087592 TaxID=3364193 RepID=UPI003829A619